MMSIERKVGRLGEVRFSSPISASDIESFTAGVVTVIKGAKEKLVFCSDMRRADVMLPEYADRLIKLLRNDNPMIERHGILIGDRAAFGLQIDRMVREAGNPSRRIFREMSDLQSWLHPLLTVDEVARAVAFYAEADLARR